MGLKSGSRDAGLDGSEGDDADETETEREETTRSAQSQRSSRQSTDSTETDDEKSDQSTSDRPTMDSIPYKLRREKVNEGREQVPYFLREEIIEAEDDLQAALEAMLDEDVYKSDYREAAMVVAQRNPELVAEVLREWGYDLNSG